MKYNMLPMVEIDVLKEALIIQYGEDFNDLRQLMFDSCYINDIYCLFWFDYLDEDDGWLNKEDVRKINCIKTFLQDTFPNYTKILIDIS